MERFCVNCVMSDRLTITILERCIIIFNTGMYVLAWRLAKASKCQSCHTLQPAAAVRDPIHAVYSSNQWFSTRGQFDPTVKLVVAHIPIWDTLVTFVLINSHSPADQLVSWETEPPSESSSCWIQYVWLHVFCEGGWRCCFTILWWFYGPHRPAVTRWHTKL